MSRQAVSDRTFSFFFDSEPIRPATRMLTIFLHFHLLDPDSTAANCTDAKDDRLASWSGRSFFSQVPSIVGAELPPRQPAIHWSSRRRRRPSRRSRSTSLESRLGHSSLPSRRQHSISSARQPVTRRSFIEESRWEQSTLQSHQHVNLGRRRRSVYPFHVPGTLGASSLGVVTLVVLSPARH